MSERSRRNSKVAVRNPALKDEKAPQLFLGPGGKSDPIGVQGKLPALKTAGGTRLFKVADVQAFAVKLREKDETRSR